MNHKRIIPSIYDIAHEAGCSPATVSRVLSKSHYPVAEITRRRILEAADKLNYTPRTVGLPGASDVVVMLPNLSNQYYVTLLSSIEATLRSSGLNTILINTRGDIAFERQIVHNLEKRVNLKLITAPVSDDISHFATLLVSDRPIVFVEQPEAGRKNTVWYDYTTAGKMMASYVMERGCKRLAYLGTSLTRRSRIQLFEGAKEVIVASGKDLDDKLFLSSQDEFSVRHEISPFHMGEQLAERLMNLCTTRPDAVLCSNDMIALGALRKFIEMGYKVPEEISVIGFDNTFNAAISYPPLTTVDSCTSTMGALAASYLLEKEKHIMLGPHLVVRKTVK